MLNGKSLVLPMVLVLLLPWLFEFVCGEQQTITATNELSKVVKHDFPKKHWKRLKKQDGAIRLVGGRSEHEGIQLFRCHLNMSIHTNLQY